MIVVDLMHCDTKSTTIMAGAAGRDGHGLWTRDSSAYVGGAFAAVSCRRCPAVPRPMAPRSLVWRCAAPRRVAPRLAGPRFAAPQLEGQRWVVPHRADLRQSWGRWRRPPWTCCLALLVLPVIGPAAPDVTVPPDVPSVALSVVVAVLPMLPVPLPVTAP